MMMSRELIYYLGTYFQLCETIICNVLYYRITSWAATS